jgi:sulfur relay (sulfurtransferase) DsrC/TusE family protein
MWLKYAEEIEARNRLQEIVAIQDLSERSIQLSKLFSDIVYGRIESTYELRDTVRKLASETNDEIDRLDRLETGRPEIQWDSLASFEDYLEWAEKSGNIDISTYAFLMSGAQKVPQYLRRYIKDFDEQPIRDFVKKMQGKIIDQLGIDISKLHSPNEWRVDAIDTLDLEIDSNTWKMPIQFVRQYHGSEDKEWGESSVVQFFCGISGVSILAEISGVSPIPVEDQKRLLEEVLYDAKNVLHFPDTISYVEGGDFKDILSGSLDKPIRLYRMMSLKEYEKWLAGEEIPVGKYFALKRSFAVGTDFSTDDPDREVFSFYSNRSLFSGESENVVQSAVPLIFENGRLNDKRI